MDNKKVDWLKRLKLLTKALEKNGVKTNLWTEIETKISGYELDFTEHDKLFADKIVELLKKNDNLVKMINELQLEKANIDCELYYAKQRIEELESNETGNTDKIPDSITIDGYKCKIIKTESGLYISRDEIYSIIDKEKEPIKQQCKELEDRHQSDCIEINRLNTTIDVLIHKVEYLRQFAGLE